MFVSNPSKPISIVKYVQSMLATSVLSLSYILFTHTSLSLELS